MNFNLELIQTYRKQIQQKKVILSVNFILMENQISTKKVYKLSLELKMKFKEEVKTGIELTKLKTLNQNSIVNLNLLLQ